MIEGGFRCDIDDRARFAREHGSRRRARQDEAGAEIQGQHAVESGGVGFPQFRAARVAADGVHEDIQPAVRREDFFDQVVDGGFVGHVHFSAREAGGVFAGVGLQRGEFAIGDVGGDDVRAFIQEGQTYGAAQASGAAGYQYYVGWLWHFAVLIMVRVGGDRGCSAVKAANGCGAIQSELL